MNVRRIVLAAALLALATGASAANTQGFIQLPGVQGPVKGQQYTGWFDLDSHDISVEATPDTACAATAVVFLKHEAAAMVHEVGETLPEVRIELVTTVKGMVRTYQAKLMDAKLRKVVTSSRRGGQIETLELVPAVIELRTWEIGPTGMAEPGSQTTVDCDGGRI